MDLNFNNALTQVTPPVSIDHNSDPIADFRIAMGSHGLCPSDIISDGEIHRFPTQGKPRHQNGYYVFHKHASYATGYYGDHASHGSSGGIHWTSFGENHPNNVDWEQIQKDIKADKTKASRDEIKKHIKAQKKAQKLWDASLPVVAHQYLTQKNIAGYGIKANGRDLLIPMRDEAGELWSLQRIDGKKKKFFYGGRVRGCSHTIAGNEKIYLCEGYATGASIHAATEGTVIIAFDTGNLPHVARQIKKPFTICADRDANGAGEIAAKKAKRAACVSADIVMPIFANSDDTIGTDFNDLAVTEGTESVRKQLNTVKHIRDYVVLFEDFKNIKTKKEQLYLDPWLQDNSITMVTGERGCGKTWFALGLLGAITGRHSFAGWKSKHTANCLYLDGEMTIRDNQKRMQLLGIARNPGLYIYCDADMASRGLMRANLGNHEWRQILKDILIGKNIKLCVFDNISSLSPGIDENSKQDWDGVNQWLLDLRFNGISTILLHHTNKSGGQRGTSGREDNIDTSIVLSKPQGYVSEDGARFVVEFTKHRGVDAENLNKIKNQELSLVADPKGQLSLSSPTYEMSDIAISIAKKYDQGLTQSEIAEALNISQSKVSRIGKELIKQNILCAKNKTLTQGGQELVFN